MTTDRLSIGEVATRSGFATSALRFYEEKGLIAATRTDGGQRVYQRAVLRQLAFIAAAKHVGLSLDEMADALDALPPDRVPTKKDWTKISRGWRSRLDQEIEALEQLRDGLDGCIGCGCLSLASCHMVNPGDRRAANGPGATILPEPVRAHP